MTKILITGANGQLGSELRNLLDERGVAYDAFDSNQMDITDQAVVNEKISALKPEVIYHCAAYTAVDNAEDVAKDLNWQVNADGTRNVAEAAKRVGAKMVYISTDGDVVCDHLSPKDMLDKMRFLCKGKTEPDAHLCKEFNKETRDGKDMSEFSKLLGDAIASIIEVKEESDIDSFLSGGQISFLSSEIKGLDDFELICFLVVR